MQFEIERKFLVKNDDWKKENHGILFKQGYIQTSPCVVRVRLEDKTGILTIKKHIQGITRYEFECTIPIDDAEYMLENICQKPVIRKYRYTLLYKGIKWIVDEFLDENIGLVIAEVELTTETQSINLPSWIDCEVSNDPHYYNSNLIHNPYSYWK